MIPLDSSHVLPQGSPNRIVTSITIIILSYGKSGNAYRLLVAKSGQSHRENVALVAIAVVIYHVQRGALVAMNALNVCDTSAVKSKMAIKRLGLEK